MKIEEIEDEWNESVLCDAPGDSENRAYWADKYVAKLIAVVKAAKAIKQVEAPELFEALEDLEREA